MALGPLPAVSVSQCIFTNPRFVFLKSKMAGIPDGIPTDFVRTVDVHQNLQLIYKHNNLHHFFKK